MEEVLEILKWLLVNKVLETQPNLDSELAVG